MIQGTGSHSGKTTLVAGLCRHFANQGLRAAPFKSQNMSLNSFVTENDEEIARATAVQARAARQKPIVHMNPILLKPKSDGLSQMIVHGKAVRDVGPELFVTDAYRDLRLEAIRRSIEVLESGYDLIVAEGAGSCAEPNLRRYDLVNMGIAHLLGARVFIVADIDKGGVFAEMLGTVKVLESVSPEDLELIEGFVVNKFRGSREALDPAIRWIEKQTGVPVVGVVPMVELDIEEEDRVRVRYRDRAEIDVAVVYLPHIANANDFDGLTMEEGVRVRFVRSADQLGSPDAVLLPGTKNTVWDLEYLRRIGFDEALGRLLETTPVLGICGGFQMLGKRLLDPERTESEYGSVPGLGFLDVEVEFLPEKTLRNRRYTPCPDNPLGAAGEVSGYEIHAGIVRYGETRPLYEYPGGFEGAFRAEPTVLGTHIHDIFKNANFTRAFVNFLRERKKLPPLSSPLPDPDARREESYDRLAALLAEHAREMTRDVRS